MGADVKIFFVYFSSAKVLLLFEIVQKMIEAVQFRDIAGK